MWRVMVGGGMMSNNFVEGVSHKIRRQIEELERVSGVESNALSVDGVPVDSYLTRCVWDEAKYPTMSPLREIVDGSQSQISKIEDDLKVRVAEYNSVRSQLNAINRKQSGSLAVRDLSNLVKPEDIITSEHLVTLLAIVPKYSQKDWLASYETLTSYVLCSFRSSKKFYEDNEYALYTVTLFGCVAENFRIAARERGFQVQFLDALLCCTCFYREHSEIWSAAVFLAHTGKLKMKPEEGWLVWQFSFRSSSESDGMGMKAVMKACSEI
ncbi:hypothetical protein SO802_001711 [Lithocarpus litseifolius]|uniref:V-type proton ATPase subunit C n=1 Tax=Lithocarpus litseifolius TaxID=425828 RepID=A0AAW2DXX1_9ROSI